MDKMPFMFAVRQHNDDKHTYAGENDNPIIKYVVCLANWDYSVYYAKWMEDKTIGDYPLVPSIDIVDTHYEFDNEAAALEKMKNLWARS